MRRLLHPRVALHFVQIYSPRIQHFLLWWCNFCSLLNPIVVVLAIRVEDFQLFFALLGRFAALSLTVLPLAFIIVMFAVSLVFVSSLIVPRAVSVSMRSVVVMTVFAVLVSAATAVTSTAMMRFAWFAALGKLALEIV
jgi:hypothetical protein